MNTVARILAICVIFSSFTAQSATNLARLAAAEEEFGTAFRSAPRSLRQHLVRANQAIEERRFGDAVAELGVLLSEQEVGDALASDVHQDFFYGSINTAIVRVSLKGEAERLLGSLPESARELYEIQFGADAQELLDLAAATGSISQLTEVTRKYFHTQAGYEATLLLGRLQLDRGHPLAAAMSLQRLVDAPSAAWKSEPELSLLSAACWARAGHTKKGREIIDGLRARFPEIALQLGGERSVGLPSGPDTELWLTTQLAGHRERVSRASTNWLMFRGDAARNAESSGDVPLPSYRWRVPTASDPTDEMLIEEIRVDKVEQRVAAIPSVQPVAVGDVILMRTPERLLAVDFETGKRVWEYPWWSASFDDVSLTSRPTTGGDELAVRREKRFQRLWQDTPYGQISSDGQSVFMLDELRYVMPMGGPFRAGLNGMRFRNPDSPESHNQLVALDLQRQGALRWMIGGETGLDEPALAGAFFLGPPLPLSGHLYVMAEIEGEIRLVVLDSATGEQQWSQQLAQVVESPIDQNVLRRLSGATPSYADGILICPTSAGAVIAVDIATRSLVWGYQYKPVPRTNNFGGFNRGFGGRSDSSDREWVDSSVTISDGTALIAPVDEDKFICLDLDLKNGEPRWEIARDNELANSLYIGCIHNGHALVVCKHQLVALAMETGAQVWEKPVELARGDSEMPSGRGFRSGDHYYLPTTTSSLVKVSLTEGRIVSRTATPSPLGNLICYKDEIVTHSAGSLASYFQLDSLRGRVAKRLEENADDSWALARQGELFLHDGKSEEALAALRRAHELDPEDDAVKGLLVSTFLTAIKLDFASHRELTEQMRPLIELPSQLAEFWRLTAEGFHEAGELDHAVDAYLSLAEVASKTTVASENSEPLLIDQDSAWSVRSDRWIQARLAQLFESDNEAVRHKIEADIATRVASSETRSLAELQDDLNHFGFHSACDPIRLAFADRLIEANRLVEAEHLLAPLRSQADRSTAGAATARMALLYKQGGEFLAAARLYQELGDQFASIPCIEDATGASLLAEAQADESIQGYFGPQRRWPWGAAEVEEKQGRSSSEILSRLVTLPVQNDERVSGDGVTFGFDRSFSAIVARDRSGNKLMEVAVDRVQENGLDQTRLMGSLGIVYFGAELIGVDMLAKARGRNEPVRWRLATTSRKTDLSDGRPAPIPFDPLPRPLPQNLDDEGRAVSSLGPVTRQGVVYQRNRTLNCVDPLTGRLAWSRTGIEQGAEISGDEEFVIVADRKEGVDQASVYRMTDGKFIAHRPLPAKASTWAMVGRYVLAWDTNAARFRLHLRDLWEQRDVWSEDVSENAKATLTSDGMLALLDTNGRFVLHSLTSDRVLVRSRLEPDENLSSLRVIPSGNDYILFANTNRTASPSTTRAIRHASAMNAPVATSRMYVIDRTTGHFRWQVPAFIDEHGFVLHQPTNSPALWFVRNVSTPQAVLSSNNVKQASILCLDRRDGKVLFAKEDIATQVNEFNVYSNASGTTSTISLPGRSITLTFTDAPMPPTPPAQTGTESSQSSDEDTLENGVGSIFDPLKEGTPADGRDLPAK